MKIQSAIGMCLIMVLSACSKLTLENYNKIEAGMSYEDVTSLIGKPEKCNDVMGIRNCTWGDEKRSVNVSFVGGKALLFASKNLE